MISIKKHLSIVAIFSLIFSPVTPALAGGPAGLTPVTSDIDADTNDGYDFKGDWTVTAENGIDIGSTTIEGIAVSAQTQTSDTGSFSFLGDSTVSGQVGAEDAYLNAISVTNNGSAVSLGTVGNASVYVNSLNFLSDGDNATVTFHGDAYVGQGNVDDGIMPEVDDYGIVNFEANATVDGNTGYNNADVDLSGWLYQVNANGGEGKLVDLKGEAAFEELHFGGNGEVRIGGMVNAYYFLNDVGGESGTGTLTLQGSGDIRSIGDLGSKLSPVNGLSVVNIDGHSGTEVTVYGFLLADEINVRAGKLTLDYDDGTFTKMDNSGDLPVLTLGGGTLNFTNADGPVVEAVDSTMLSTGSSHVTNDGSGVVLQMNGITRNAGATIDFSDNNIASTSTPNDASGILGAWATVGGTDYAAVNGSGSIMTYAYTAGEDIDAYGGVIQDGADTNVRINTAEGAVGTPITLGTTTDPTGWFTIHTLLQNTIAAATVNTASGKGSLDVNGIMIGAGMGSLTLGVAANDSHLYAATKNGEIVLINNSTLGNLTINASIGEWTNPVASSSIVKSGVGALILNSTNTYTGATTISEGTLSVGKDANLGGVNELIFDGGTLKVTGIELTDFGSHAPTFNSGKTVGLNIDSEDNNFTVDEVMNQGTGGLTKEGAGALTLNGTNTYSGGTTLNEGMLNIGSESALGTGMLTLNGGAIDNTSGDDLTLANDIAQSWNENFTFLGSHPLDMGKGPVTLNKNITLTLSGDSAELSVGGDVSGNGGINLVGNDGVLYLLGDNSYEGTTFVNSGTLWVGSDNALGSTDGGTEVAANASLLLSGFSTGSGIAVGDEALTLNGKGSDLFGQDGALLSVLSDDSWGGEITLASDSAILVALSKLQLNGVVKGPGGLEVNSIAAGELGLNGENTYTGVTTLNDGAIVHLGSAEIAGVSGPLGKSAAVNPGSIVMNGGKLQYSDVNKFDYSGRFSTAADQKYGVDTNGQNVTWATALTSSGGSLSKDGLGTLTLSGANTYAGATLIYEGTLMAGIETQAFGVGSSVTVGSTGILDINGHNQTLGSLSGSGTVVNGDSVPAYLTVGDDTSTTFSGVIKDGTPDAIGLIKVGTGTLTLSGANTYTGGTIVNAGTLLLDMTDSGALAETSSLTLGGGTFSILGAAEGVILQIMASLNVNAGKSNIVIDPNTSVSTTLTITDKTIYCASRGSVNFDTSAGTPVTAMIAWDPVLTGGIIGGGFTMKDNGGTGFATVTGGYVTRYDDSTGTTLASDSNNADTNFTTLNTVYTDGVLAWTGGGMLENRSVNSLTIDTANHGGTIDMGAAANVLTLTSGAILFTGAQDETLTGGQVGAADSELIVHQTGTGMLTIASLVSSGEGSLVKDGTGTLILTGANTYTGVTAVNAGVLNIQNETALGTTAAGTFVASGAALEIQGDIDVDDEALTLNGTGTGAATGALRNISGNNTWWGTISLGSATRINADAGQLNLMGAITGADQSLTIGGARPTLIYGVISTGDLIKDGAGILALDPMEFNDTPNTYTGSTTINGGMLRVYDDAGIPVTSAVTVASGAQLHIDTASGPVEVTLGSLSGSGDVRFTANGILTVGDATSTTFGGVIYSSSSYTAVLTKTGTGTLTLTGANTYTGATTISEGTLQVGDGGTSGTLGSGNVTNNSVLEFNRSDDLTVSSVISGSGYLYKNGAGTLTLSSSNTYTGRTYIGGGTVYLTADQSNTRFTFVYGDDAYSDEHTLLRVKDGVNITGDITNYGVERGTLTFEGSSTMDGRVGDYEAGGSLHQVNVGAAGSTVTFKKNIGAYEIHFTSITTDGTMIFEDGVDYHALYGDAFMTTETNGLGILEFQGDSEVDATVGASGAFLNKIDVAQGSHNVNLGTVDSPRDVYINQLNFGPDPKEKGATSTTVSFFGDAHIGAGGITTEWSLYGNVYFTSNATVEGSVGAENARLGTVYVAQGKDHAVNFNGDTYLSSLYFWSDAESGAGDATVTFNGNANIDRGITTGWFHDGGIINFNGNASVTSFFDAIGSEGAALKEVNFLGAGSASWIGKNVYADQITVGTGTVDFDGNVYAGTLMLQSGSIAGEGTLTVDGDFDLRSGSISNVLAGAGDLTKTTAGTVTLSGANTYTGTTTISAGTLQVGNSSALSDGDVTNNATLDVGSIALNIAGDYSQAAAATLNLTINSATTSGGVLVGGATSVEAGSNVSVVVPTGTSISNGTEFTIITTSDSVDDSLATPTVTSNTRRYAFTASEKDGNLIITSSEGSYVAPSGATGNESAVANVLNGIPNPTGDMNTVLDQLGPLSPSEYEQALDTMHPDVSSGAADGSRSLTSQGFTTVSNRLGGARNGGASVSGISSGDSLDGVGVWMQALGSNIKQGERKGVEGYNGNLFGTTIGADKVIDNHFRAGFAGSYGWARVKSKTSGSPSDDINSFQGTIYGSFDSLDLNKARQGGKKSYEAVRSQVEKSWYVDGMFAFTQNNYDSRREIWVTPASERIAKAEHYGQQYSTNFEAGYKFVFEKTKNLEVTPFVGLGYNYLYLNKYKENGASSLNLTVDGQGFNQLEQSLGTKLAYPLVNKKVGTFIPSAKAAWLYDYVADTFETTASFAGGGASFNTQGAKPARNGMLFGAELAFLNKGNVTLTGNWDIELKDQYMSNTYYGTARYDF